MIYFIGAGPGAADLITLRGMRLLEKASLVIYAGSLVNPELLEFCSPNCERLNSASMTLEEVISALNTHRQDETVVRLHTGDPSLYGAIREQMDALDKLDIAYEIVPGVSSRNAAAAALRAEVTSPIMPLSMRYRAVWMPAPSTVSGATPRKRPFSAASATSSRDFSSSVVNIFSV